MTLGKDKSAAGNETSGDAADAASHELTEIKSLLFATDLSARSDRALERALELAGRHGARLTVLHVVDEDLPGTVQSRVIESARDEIAACVDKYGRPDNIELTIRVVPGTDYQDIVQIADLAEADMVVLGIHRNESGEKPLAGTTMERVIRRGPLPVLVAANRVMGPYKKVMVAVDFSVYSRFAIRTAVAIAPPDTEFHFVHVFHIPFEGFQPGLETRRAVRADLERDLAEMIDGELAALVGSSLGGRVAGGQVHRKVIHGGVEAMLRDEVNRAQPDLLVLGTHGRVGISHLVLGSVAEDFLNRPPCDVMAVKAW